MEVTVLNRQRSHRVEPRRLAAFVDRLAAELPPQRGDVVGVCLVSDRRMREYQRRFRGRDATTDVLAFPWDDPPPPDGSAPLGDIVISVATAARQARRARHSLLRELQLLTLHGYLHLLGFDHEHDGGRMLRLQRRLQRKLLPQRPGGGGGERR